MHNYRKFSIIRMTNSCQRHKNEMTSTNVSHFYTRASPVILSCSRNQNFTFVTDKFKG